MYAGRRTILLQSLATAGALGALATTEKARSSTERHTLSLADKVQRLMDRDVIENTMNKYEQYLGLGYLEEALALFALNTPDVKADVGFGIYEGPASIRRLYLGLHKRMIGDRNDPSSLKNGAMYILSNTTGTIEIAGDGKTAKGLWFCPGFSTRVDTNKKEANATWSWAKRGVDFIREADGWKIWHYQVYGVFYTPFHKAWTETDNAANLDFSWIPADLRPDRSSPTAGGTMFDINKPTPAAPRPPEPYWTFSETFPYMT